MARTFTLERLQVIPRTVEEVFPFFADPANLARITPDSLDFRITSEGPTNISPGTLIDYRLSLFGIPFRWRSRIETVEENRRFTDVQVRGPYRRWHHLHRFWSIPQGTLMLDRVEYELPLGIVGRLAHRAFVRRSLERIFEYRRKVLRLLFPSPPSSDSSPSLQSTAA